MNTVADPGTANSVRTLAPAALKAALHDGGEIALLDAREEVVFDARHLLMAACVPLSRLELIVDACVPRRVTRVVWCDNGEGLAELAAARMVALGYTDVSVLAGGITAWEAADYKVYSGVHVPSKAFAEVVEHTAGTPHITAEQLKQWQDASTDMVLFDSRSFGEFHENSIPGAVSVPGAELLYRFADQVPSRDTVVVVNCGGRTRSIIGAQSLINAGVPNKVYSLKNGTQAWHLAGFDVLKGVTRSAPVPSAVGHAAVRKLAAKVADRFGVGRIDLTSLGRFLAETDRTTYLFDVRSAEEYRAGHFKGAKHVPGGQLVQETDRHAAVWGARIVVIDSDGVRAVMTAHWLKQMGWEAAALTVDLSRCDPALVAQGPWQPTVPGLESINVRTLDPAGLREHIAAGGVSVIDVDWSRDYRDGHVPSAWYGIRARLYTILPKMPPGDAIVFTSGDGVLARLAAADAAKLTTVPVYALEGGTAAWRAAGLPMEEGLDRLATQTDDIRLKARNQSSNIEEAMQQYLAWEIDLVNRMAEDDDQRFRVQTG